MPLGCPIQDGDNNDCQEDDRGVKRGVKSLCEAKLSWNEVLDFASRDFSEYARSLRALDRRVEFFNGIT